MPGKFESATPYAEELYEAALMGEDDGTLGSCQENGFVYSLFLNFTTKTGEMIHAILTEDHYGFVDSELFDTSEQATKQWGRIEKVIYEDDGNRTYPL